MNDVIISVEHLSKRYRLGEIGATTLRESAERFWHKLRGRNPDEHMGKIGRPEIGNLKLEREKQESKNAKSEIGNLKPESADKEDPSQVSGFKSQVYMNDDLWALNDVSFEVRRGEVLGVIGRNGAGKSTLLKILSRITDPTSGRAIMRGRVGSLLEVGTGFHPELTGRENIFLNGAILGMRKKEIAAKFDEIVAFAEVNKFIDTPVKRYSSGMYVRLAFAVAAHLDPEILLVDEVLAVGDAAFQKKCLGKMGEVAHAGRTVLFVSHNMPAMTNLCHDSLLLESGRIGFTGPTEQAVAMYLDAGLVSGTRTLAERTDRQGSGRIRFLDAWVEDDRGVRTDCVMSGQDTRIVAVYESSEPKALRSFCVAFFIAGPMGEAVCDLKSETVAPSWDEAPSQGRVTCALPRLPLNAGAYTFGVYAQSSVEIVDWVLNAGTFQVVAGDFYGTGRLPASTHGHFLFNQAWKLEAIG
jgi:lipopolysaccharide transport system ATP-binding protein